MKDAKLPTGPETLDPTPPSGDAVVIPLHGADAAPLARPRRRGRPVPGPGRPEAAILALPAGDPTSSAAPAPAPATIRRPSRDERWAEALAFVRRRLDGDYEVDEFGFDRDLAANAVLPVLKPLYDQWFRVEVNGIEHIPDVGGALLVANHAGGIWAVDAAMTAVAVHTEHPAGRFLRLLGADLVFSTPGLGSLARKAGTARACSADAERLLADGELVGVWPEGFKGIGKPFRERYKLQRFGRGGFVHAAIKAGVPIIPVSIVGSEEIHPVLGNAKALARLLNLPYFPLTPTFPWLGPLGLVPLPSKWYIEFGAAIHTEALSPDAADDAVAVFDITDRVRETIQSTLYRLLVQRRSVWR
ncbi:MAG TPA: lysophospholipid acyltransferase family protein [Jatrophihabitans sp.]|jgi:1-acyl-sn-glycerol-3-phosphate acyltransferase|uniref:lysophospholipid acyltransferase family protein n=1 Tax=Jatrophihabitans sp. TaxID=1932789 RepID=UPI002E0B3DBB|nr:lysophospholipid acyltransferase family protein [Jatrophihabitans sp.]